MPAPLCSVVCPPLPPLACCGLAARNTPPRPLSFSNQQPWREGCGGRGPQPSARASGFGGRRVGGLGRVAAGVAARRRRRRRRRRDRWRWRGGGGGGGRPRGAQARGSLLGGCEPRGLLGLELLLHHFRQLFVVVVDGCEQRLLVVVEVARARPHVLLVAHPQLAARVADEPRVVRDEDDASLELADGVAQRVDGLGVQAAGAGGGGERATRARARGGSWAVGGCRRAAARRGGGAAAARRRGAAPPPPRTCWRARRARERAGAASRGRRRRRAPSARPRARTRGCSARGLRARTGPAARAPPGTRRRRSPPARTRRASCPWAARRQSAASTCPP
jgi:hypothetical protein